MHRIADALHTIYGEEHVRLSGDHACSFVRVEDVMDVPILIPHFDLKQESCPIEHKVGRHVEADLFGEFSDLTTMADNELAPLVIDKEETKLSLLHVEPWVLERNVLFGVYDSSHSIPASFSKAT